MEIFTPPPCAGEAISIDYARKLARWQRAHHLIAGKNIRLSHTPNGTIISSTSAGKSRMVAATARTWLPFDVRWNAAANDGEGEWQIYLPAGSLTVHYGEAPLDSTFVTDERKDAFGFEESYFASAGYCSGKMYIALEDKLDAAHGQDGSELFEWRRLDIEGVDPAAESETGGNAVKSWDVYAVCEPWARYSIEFSPDGRNGGGAKGWVRRVATIYETRRKENGGGEGGDDGGDGAGGDEESKNKGVLHSCKQHYDGQIALVWKMSGTFAVDYVLDDESDKRSDCHIEIVHQKMMCGRTQVAKSAATVIECDGVCEVWVRLVHTNENLELQVLDSCPGSSDDDQTVFKIYDIEDGHITGDYRDSIPFLPFYTSEAYVEGASESGAGGGSGE